MPNLAAITAKNARLWQIAKIVPKREAEVIAVAKRLTAPEAKLRYQAVSQVVSAKTGVPWAVIAVIHERECSQDWMRSLAQGDRWDRASVHVPAGRGPFESWEAAAIDALVNCAPYAGRNKDWSIGGALTELEEYNGLGYAARSVPSPYIWSGTDQYISGKYIRDGVYDPEAIDSQLGCAGLLMAMMALDPTITFAGATAAPAQPTEPIPNPMPGVASPSAKGSIGAFISSVFSTLLKCRRK